MSETTTYWVFGTALLLLLLSVWRSRRPYVPGSLPIVPWTGVLYLSLVVSLLMLAHLISIWTGQPLIGRRG